MKKANCYFACLVLTVLVITPLKLLSQSSPKKYNVLFISTHDMNFRVNFLGHEGPSLPNLNRLVARGMVFYNNYCQYPFCSPSRTSLLTGWRPDRTGVFNDNVRPRTLLGPDVKFLPEYFSLNGYYTERYGIVTQGRYANDITTWNYAEPPESEEKATAKGTTAKEDGGTWWIDNKPDTAKSNAPWALHLAQRMAQPVTEPFFYALGFNETHNPFTPNLSNWNINGDPNVTQSLPDKEGDLRYTGNGSGNILLPNTPRGDRDDVPPIAFNIDAIAKTDSEWRNTKHAYYGDVSQMDTYVGWVLDKMDEQNLWDNTIVVFWVDHGQHLGEHEGTWLKLTLFEESNRIPFIICVPGKKPGVCYRVTENVDLYATLAELCGLPTPPEMEGSSLAPLFDDPTLPWKRSIFTQVKRGPLMARSVRTEDFHYNNWGTNGEELYDLRTDSNEYTNLAANAAYATVLDSMRTILAEGWTKSVPPKYSLKTFYKDADGDNYGLLADSLHAYAKPGGYAAVSGDCNDANPNINPGKAEICDGLDNNCNNKVDEGTPRPTINFNGSTDICTTGSLLLRTSAGAGYTYQWLRDGVNIAGATQRTYLAIITGIYTVRVIQPSGCNRVSQGVSITNSCGGGIALKNRIDKDDLNK